MRLWYRSVESKCSEQSSGPMRAKVRTKIAGKQRMASPAVKARYAQIRAVGQMQEDATNHLQSEATDPAPSPQTRHDAPARRVGPCPCALVLHPIAPRGQVLVP